MNLRRLYNQNRKTIWRVIIIIAFVILIIQLLNYLTIQSNKEENQSNNDTTTSSTTTSTQNQISKGNTTTTSTSSSVTGATVSTGTLTTATETINTFIEYCNSGDITNAYNLLTDECKEQIYPTVDDFEQNYYNTTFTTTLTCTLTNWINSTYKVKLQEDALATGKVSSSYIEDYMTIVNVDGEYKLNISSYIGRTEINETTTNKDISVEIVSKDTYMDYEIYNIVVKNNSDATVVLDTLEDTDTIYVQSTSDTKYSSSSHEIIKDNLILKSKYTRELSIKFSNSYSSSIKINRLVFSNVILDYEEYSSLDDKSEYTDFYTFVANT